MWVLQGHYRSERDFSIESLEAARIRRLNWRNRVVECFQKQNRRNIRKQEKKRLAFRNSRKFKRGLKLGQSLRFDR